MQGIDGRVMPRLSKSARGIIESQDPGWFTYQERYLRSLPFNQRHVHWDWLLTWFPLRTHVLAFRFDPLTIIWGLGSYRRRLITDYFKSTKKGYYQPTLHRYFKKLVRTPTQVSIRRYIVSRAE